MNAAAFSSSGVPVPRPFRFLRRQKLHVVQKEVGIDRRGGAVRRAHAIANRAQGGAQRRTFDNGFMNGS